MNPLLHQRMVEALDSLTPGPAYKLALWLEKKAAPRPLPPSLWQRLMGWFRPGSSTPTPKTKGWKGDPKPKPLPEPEKPPPEGSWWPSLIGSGLGFGAHKLTADPYDYLYDKPASHVPRLIKRAVDPWDVQTNVTDSSEALDNTGTQSALRPKPEPKPFAWKNLGGSYQDSFAQSAGGRAHGRSGAPLSGAIGSGGVGPMAAPLAQAARTSQG